MFAMCWPARTRSPACTSRSAAKMCPYTVEAGCPLQVVVHHDPVPEPGRLLRLDDDTVGVGVDRCPRRPGQVDALMRRPTPRPEPRSETHPRRIGGFHHRPRRPPPPPPAPPMPVPGAGVVAGGRSPRPRSAGSTPPPRPARPPPRGAHSPHHRPVRRGEPAPARHVARRRRVTMAGCGAGRGRGRGPSTWAASCRARSRSARAGSSWRAGGGSPAATTQARSVFGDTATASATRQIARHRDEGRGARAWTCATAATRNCADTLP